MEYGTKTPVAFHYISACETGLYSVLMKTCAVCRKSVPKYRCPSCRIQYCSVLCFKTHKQDNSCESETNKLIKEKQEQQEEKESQISKSEVEEGEISSSDSEDEDKVKKEDLNKLGQSSKLKEILQNKHLRHMISHIDGSNTANEDLQHSMTVPIFSEFVDECLKVVKPTALNDD